MSENELLYLDTGLSPQEAAQVLVDRLDLELLPPRRPDGHPVVWAADVLGVSAGGTVAVHHWLVEDLEDHTVDQDYPLVWRIWSQQRQPEYRPQKRAAHALFQLVVERLAWPCVLTTWDGQVVVARYDPRTGIEYFPPGTSSDYLDAHVWDRARSLDPDRPDDGRSRDHPPGATTPS